MDGQCSVLIVDRSEETQEVLQTVLERRGVRTLAAGETSAALKLVRQCHPDLIVLDLESCDPLAPAAFGEADEASSTDGAAETSARQQQQYQPHLVLLGNLRGWRKRFPAGELVSKPYHYAPLVRKIEELLASCRPEPVNPNRAHAVCNSRHRPGEPLRTD